MIFWSLFVVELIAIGLLALQIPWVWIFVLTTPR
jgi:hypothetical protein